MNCRQCQEHLSEELEPDGGLPLEVQAHLRSCSSCAGGQRALAAALGALRRLPREPVPAGFRESVLERVGTAADGGEPVAAAPPDQPGEPLSRSRSRPAGAVPAVPPAIRLARLLLQAAAVAALLLSAFALGRSTIRLTPAGEQATGPLGDRLRRLEEEATAQKRLLDGPLAHAARTAGLEKEVRRLRGQVAVFHEEEEALALRLETLENRLDHLPEARPEAAPHLPEASPVALKPSPPSPPPDLPPAPGDPSPAAPQFSGPAAAPLAAKPPPRAAAAVAFDRRRAEGGELAIDLRGPDSRVVPALIALAQSEDQELAGLALRLLRERISASLPPEPKGGAAPAARAARGNGFLDSMGSWLETVARSSGLSTAEEREETPAAGSRAEELGRIRQIWEDRAGRGEGAIEAGGERL